MSLDGDEHSGAAKPSLASLVAQFIAFQVVRVGLLWACWYGFASLSGYRNPASSATLFAFLSGVIGGSYDVFRFVRTRRTANLDDPARDG